MGHHKISNKKNAADVLLTKIEKKEPRKQQIDKEVERIIDEGQKYKINYT